MERDFNNDEFEFFLKQKADQYKIYPSEKSWRNIHNSLHTRWKWFTLGGSLILLTSLFFFSNDLTFNNSSRINRAAEVTSKNKPVNARVITPPIKSSTPAPSVSTSSPRNVQSSTNTVSPLLSGRTKKTALNSPEIAGSTSADTKAGVRNPGAHLFNPSVAITEEKNINIDAVAMDQIEQDDADLISKVEMHIAPLMETKAALSGEINWMEEMTAIKLTAQKRNPFHLQFYFSPTVSYRRLADNKAISGINQQNIPLASGNANIDKYVDHKPSIGAELGSNILFSAGRNLTFKTGLQLNYSRYTIKAYKFYFEKASIALNTLGPIGDTITAYTSFRNFSGYSPEELQNQYLQISVPIGAELKLLGNKRLQLNIAGTIQPTYLLLNDSYLLSTDYVNYAKEPSLVRKWNVHTSMEAFVSYKMGGVRWQVGPQFRYQLMSSYNDRYPIKEYLFEYGVKVGVSKTIR